MQQFLKAIMILAIVLSIPLLARGIQAQENLQVKIAPASPAVAKHSHSHDITADDLTGRTTTYVLGSHPDDSHGITLTSGQLADIAEGTTVIVRTSKDKDSGMFKSHQHRVSITLEAEAESGW